MRYGLRTIGPSGLEDYPDVRASTIAEAEEKALEYSKNNPGLIVLVIDLKDPERGNVWGEEE